MRILFASSEVFPFSKTGGLGDVLGALPEALVALGHEVMVASPWYKTLKGQQPLWIGDEWVAFNGGLETCGVGHLEKNGVQYVFVGHGYFQREHLYGYGDDVKRFCLFTRAVPQAAAKLNFAPDIVHAHDWHTAYLPMVLEKAAHLPEGFPNLPSVFTIHNIQHQGDSGLEETVYWLRMPPALKGEHMNHFGGANALQAGLGFAHHVTTVSPTYAAEIQSPQYGYGLDGTLRHISGKLSGILNGIDTDIWTPEGNDALAQPYEVGDLSGKAENKRVLESRFGLTPGKPLAGVVSRLADQKGIDILLDAASELLWQDWSLVVLGSGQDELEARLHALTGANPGRVGSHIGYDERLAHLVYAGVDSLLIPSRFEPCGLTQMIAMRYGTLPIARATGGLVDTIQHDVTGFLFEHAEPEGLLWATKVARDAFDSSQHWRYMGDQASQQDFSWARSAQRYSELYGQLSR